MGKSAIVQILASFFGPGSRHQMNTKSGHGRKNGSYAWAQKHKASLDTATGKCQPAKTFMTLVWHRSPGSLAVYPLAVWCFGAFTPWKGWCFIATGIRVPLNTDLGSFSSALLPKSPSKVVLNLNHLYRTPY